MREDFVWQLLAGLKEGGIGLVSGVPDSWLLKLHEACERDPDITYVPVGNEGVGFSICAGAWLGGKKSALIMQNTGLRPASQYIALYSMGSKIPVLLIMSYRGDMGDPESWSIPHGIVVEPLLNALRIPYVVVREVEKLQKAVIRAITGAEVAQFPTAVLIGGDLIWP